MNIFDDRLSSLQKKQYYQENMNEISKTNVKMVFVISTTILILELLLFLFGILWKNENFGRFITPAMILLVVLAIFMWSSFQLGRRPHSTIINRLYLHVFITLLLLFVIYLSTVVVKHYLGAYFYIFIIAMPIPFLITYRELTIGLIAHLTIYAIFLSVFKYKGTEFIYVDLFFAISAAMISLPINFLLYHIRVKQGYYKLLYDQYSKMDELTQLPNRRGFNHYMLEAVEKAIIKKESLAVCFIDIDDFKQFNDHHGHIMGDFVLRKVGHSMVELKDDSADIFNARYGGEEFIAIVKKRSSQDVYHYMDRLRKKISELILPDKQVKLTVSIGIYYLNRVKYDDVQKIIQKADDAMYCSKKEGKNKITIEIKGDS